MRFLVRDWLVLLAGIALCILASVLLARGEALLIYSMVGMLFLFTLFFSYLNRLEQRFPIFEVGFFLVGLTFIYSFYPLFAFMVSGFEWSVISDNRLRTSAGGVDWPKWQNLVFTILLI